MSWKKHSLETHIVGISLAMKYKCSDKPFLKSFYDDVIKCFGAKCRCPIDLVGAFSDGIYYNGDGEQCFAKFDGVWYTYNGSKMFKYYSKQLEAAEIDMKDRDTIVKISNTKYATKEQIELAKHIKSLKWARKTKLEAFRLHKRAKAKIEAHKESKKLKDLK